MAVNAEQNQQKDQQDLTSQPGTQTSTSSGGVSAQPESRVANYSSGSPSTGSTGSGRFTNLSKYLNANQGAGDRLASGISSNLDKQNAGEKRELNTQAGDVRAGIEAAQNKVNTGNQYVNQVNSANFNAQDVAGDQNKLQDFTNYRTNQAVDTNTLNNQANTAQTTGQNLQAQQQQQLQNASTEQGRFNLLKQAFGGGTVYQNPYSTGQQKLDQLFLQAGGANNINNLQNQVRSGINDTGQVLNNLGQNTSTIGDISTQTQGIAKGLQDKTNSLTNDYVSGIENTAGQVNAQRSADQKFAQDQYTKLQNGQAIDQRFATMLGLNQGQGLYNTLNGKNVNDFLNFGNTNLQGFGQLANADQEKQYGALASLAGMTPAFTADGNPTAAVTNNNTINNTLNSGQQAYDQATTGKNATADWGGGNIIDLHGNIGLQQAGNLLGGLSSQGVASLRGLNAANANNFNESVYSQLSPQDKQILQNAAQQVGVSSSWGNNQALGGDLYNPARISALQNAANSLYDQGYWNRVNIAPPSDTESGGQFGVK